MPPNASAATRRDRQRSPAVYPAAIAFLAARLAYRPGRGDYSVRARGEQSPLRCGVQRSPFPCQRRSSSDSTSSVSGLLSAFHGKAASATAPGLPSSQRAILPAVKTDLLLIPMGARWADLRAAAVAADEGRLRRAVDLGSSAGSRRRSGRRAGVPHHAGRPRRGDQTRDARLARAERLQSASGAPREHGRHPPADLRWSLHSRSGCGRQYEHPVRAGAGGDRPRRRTRRRSRSAGGGSGTDPSPSLVGRSGPASRARTIDSTGRTAICAAIPRRPSSSAASARAWRPSRGSTATASIPRPAIRASPSWRGSPAPSTRRPAAIRHASSLSVFAGLAPAWLRPDSENRAALQRMGVDRLILLTEPPYDPSQIRAAGRVLSG